MFPDVLQRKLQTECWDCKPENVVALIFGYLNLDEKTFSGSLILEDFLGDEAEITNLSVFL